MQRQILFEINTRIWIKQLSRELGKDLNLGNIPDSVWLKIKDQGFDWIWLMGIWKPSKISQQKAREAEFLQQFERQHFPASENNHIQSSPYAIADYQPNPQLGNFNDLYKLHHQLNRLGLKLILDFVPNHTALDHPWVTKHPEYYLQIPSDKNLEKSYRPKSTNLNIAYGKDPFFEPWTDTAQLNYANIKTREAMQKTLQKIANYCDGVRCDMAMLVTNSVFKKTWQEVLQENTQTIPDKEFWQSAVKAVKNIKPEFILIAEVYWQMENQLWQQGFDFCYDKTLYDHFESKNSQNIYFYLKKISDNIQKFVHFSENHDEPRCITHFGKNALAITTFNYILPGLNLIHQGQTKGKKIKLPVQIDTAVEEKLDLDIKNYFDKLFKLNQQGLFAGKWQMLEVRGLENSDLAEGIIACQWQNGQNLTIIAINIADHSSQGHIIIKLTERGETEFYDHISKQKYQYKNQDINTYGLYVDLKPGQTHIFSVK